MPATFAANNTATTPIEAHPDYPYAQQMAELDRTCIAYELEASRWVADLLATIMHNTELLSSGYA